MRPDPETKELTAVSLHPGVTREQVRANAGWPIRFADAVAETPAPSEQELAALRDLRDRSARAHAGEAGGLV